ncbi:unnamed protein product [Heligmosomoides polygyrus]|uniref:RNA helicase n=1 Tax=Heligmosomoides polygyrus TaxID=6339 RepID=A0A3P7ZB13_HELPZ|nr:unnamed protein product [Heligmosomoides polygyrus]
MIATPGRLLHVIVEMDLRLSAVQYVVFDEADRLFEMGFQDQLSETLKRIPESRQTLLFSATLPKMLVDFAKAGLSDPVLVRLDVDEKISDRLSMVFATCRAEEKLAVLLHLCRQMDADNKQTVVFCATMKHVEYVVGIMNRAGIQNSFIYSQLDATARKLNIAKFKERENNILIVTDVAARGVDIPLLDTVIILHFPPKPKLFVHRVGRVARAGRSGTAISLIAPDELPYLTDLFLFLGKPMRFAKDEDKYDGGLRLPEGYSMLLTSSERDVPEETTLIGKAPETVAGLEAEFLNSIHDNNEEMVRAFTLKVAECSAHPFLRIANDCQQYSILNQLAKYKSAATIFELNVGHKSQSVAVMKEKRRQHQERIRAVKEEKARMEEALKSEELSHLPSERAAAVESADEAAISEVFTEVVGRGVFGEAKKSKLASKIDKAEERRREKARNFIAYSSADYASEKHLALDKVDFAKHADGATVEIFADDDKGMYRQKHAKRWDRKKKRFVGTAGDGQDIKRIRTEDGTWLPASYKTGRYEDWKKKQKIGYKKDEQVEEDGQEAGASGGHNKSERFDKWKNHNRKQQAKGPKSEIRNVSQIKKIRMKSAKLQEYMEHRRQENLKKKANRGGGGGPKRGGGGGPKRGGGTRRK